MTFCLVGSSSYVQLLAIANNWLSLVSTWIVFVVRRWPSRSLDHYLVSFSRCLLPSYLARFALFSCSSLLVVINLVRTYS